MTSSRGYKGAYKLATNSFPNIVRSTVNDSTYLYLFDKAYPVIERND